MAHGYPSYEEQLYPIGKLAQTCGVTRRMILNYEDHGLIEPLEVSRTSGYRRYGVTSVARISHIVTLQRSGLSLNQIDRYLDGDEDAVRENLERLEELQRIMKRQAALTEALLVPMGEPFLKETVLAAEDAYTVTRECRTADDCYLLACNAASCVLENGWRIAQEDLRLKLSFTGPIESGAAVTAAFALAESGPHTTHFAETRALCLGGRVKRGGLSAFFADLRAHAEERGQTATGPIRVGFISSPQSHPDAQNYCVLAFLPVD